MNATKIREKIAGFENCEATKALRRLEQERGLIGILGKSRSETCHSNFLQWLFDLKIEGRRLPAELLLRCVAARLVKSGKRSVYADGEQWLSVIESGEFVVKSSQCNREVQAKYKRKGGAVDIVLECLIENKADGSTQKVNVVIENKTESKVHDNQLERYYKSLSISKEYKKDFNLFVLLAPNPETLEAEEHYIPLIIMMLWRA